MVQANSKMLQPTNVKDLQCFLSMVNCLNTYSPRLAEVGDNLHEFTEKMVLFLWYLKTQKALSTLKQELGDVLVLKYYSTAKSLVLQMDASLKGLATFFALNVYPYLLYKQKFTI